ncbi:MAG: molybdopterin dehydrogenase [Clostridia bacterium]|nr:FAD binding domain-containing protein [Lachnospiraceae bacterium]NCB99849.1 molybdopterin dehydrogenase [Clostridia bacterium]NCD02788.1 molybdopterin dehydrogenase [Clostridia bacterium]
MYTIQGYSKVKTLEEAYELNQKRSSTIIGGGMWLRLGNRSIGTAIDMSDLGLNQIEETETEFVIGAMTSLRDIECHAGLHQYFNGMMKEAMKGIVGTQFRNTATIGGSIYQRFGFSDPLTALLALDTTVEMYAGGMIPLDKFVIMDYDNDVLVRIHIKKDRTQAAYQSFRNAKTDFPVLTAAVSRRDGKLKVVIGARPGRAVVAKCPDVLASAPTEEDVKKFSGRVAEMVSFGTNMRASAEYRKILAEVLVKRAIMEILEQTSPEATGGVCK